MHLNHCIITVTQSIQYTYSQLKLKRSQIKKLLRNLESSNLGWLRNSELSPPSQVSYKNECTHISMKITVMLLLNSVKAFENK